ncbi:putative monooxygenase ydhR [Brevibacterium sanguinis]|uniref:Monooxygenase ydhR n=2 Tax=Brevibacterium TaxID=1696 RepID=A0ABX9GTS5_9MICO|nr:MULTISPECIES: YdhR family protein [Brevibacterium]RBP67803.1 putative monooxygenase ydhR [Brevibacterium sanguinis]RBP74780.1 putative monooxygenase ydhR [Brevibacterium celere]
MKILQVDYRRELSSEDHGQAERMRAAATKIANVPGLLWKIWAFDDEARRAVSYYLFDTEEHARAWGEGPLRESLGSNPGVSDISTSYYEVDRELSAITRGPISEASLR